MPAPQLKRPAGLIGFEIAASMVAPFFMIDRSPFQDPIMYGAMRPDDVFVINDKEYPMLSMPSRPAEAKAAIAVNDSRKIRLVFIFGSSLIGL